MRLASPSPDQRTRLLYPIHGYPGTRESIWGGTRVLKSWTPSSSSPESYAIFQHHSVTTNNLGSSNNTKPIVSGVAPRVIRKSCTWWVPGSYGPHPRIASIDWLRVVSGAGAFFSYNFLIKLKRGRIFFQGQKGGAKFFACRQMGTKGANMPIMDRWTLPEKNDSSLTCKASLFKELDNFIERVTGFIVLISAVISILNTHHDTIEWKLTIWQMMCRCNLTPCLNTIVCLYYSNSASPLRGPAGLNIVTPHNHRNP